MSLVKNAKFWEYKSLQQLTADEWESLCDRCGKCCMHSLEDEDNGVVYGTSVACKLLDRSTGQCKNYRFRKQFVDDCVSLDINILQTIKGLPSSCAYRTLAEGRKLPNWHPLISGTYSSVKEAGFSVIGTILTDDAETAEEDFVDFLLEDDIR